MSEQAVFLAYREPGEELKFYTSDPHSERVFHFVDFNSERPLKLGMREVAPKEAFNFYCHKAPESFSRAEQLQLLEESIASLKEGRGSKVVISRFVLKEGLRDPLKVLRALDQHYPRATVYCFSHPEVGTWLGASPEKLLGYQAGQLEMASLAGTRTWEDRDSFTDKEKREQAIVSEEILRVLAHQEGISEITTGDLSIRRAGNLAHLYRPIYARLDKPSHLEQLLAALHPTPAVGGQPREWALNWIREHELYSRRFYTGFFGWSDKAGQTAQFWVNLRCAEYVEGPSLAIYVGGGITAESNALLEWEETEHKAQTILNVLD